MNKELLCPSLCSTFAGTRDDFVSAMKSLGATVEAAKCAGPSYDPLRVLLRCSTDRWVQVFGPVRILAVQFGPGGQAAFQAWKYQCADGAVLCIGCQYQRCGGDQAVMVRALYFD
jgi:hypothetical protein